MAINATGTPGGTDVAGDAFVFRDEEADAATGEDRHGPLWVLSVDDDRAFQDSLRLALAGFRFQGRPLQLLAAGSAAEAAKQLVGTPDVAVVLLDVVMETDDAGLRLVRNVREVMGNAEVRIVLLTGQPGMAPMQESLHQLDISDYWLKTELSQERLHGILTGNLRTWEQIRALGRAKRGLQAIVEASNSLTRVKGLQEFSGRMIGELSRLLGVPADGLVCVQVAGDGEAPLDAPIVGAAGRFAPLLQQPLRALQDDEIRGLLVDALACRSATGSASSQVLFFPGADDVPHAAAYLATGRRLDDTEYELLRVFATQVNSGLINVALTSRLDRIAYEDALLGIPNGNALMRMLECALQLPSPRGRILLLVDLDQYAQSSLSLGVEQGDLLLRQMAQRLQEAFPPPCLTARLHEDTFAILGPVGLLDRDRIERLNAPHGTGHAPFIGLGAARLDLDQYHGSARGAVAACQLLLKRARRQRLGRVVDYTPDMERQTSRRFLRSHALYQALRSDEIHVALQAQVDLRSGRVVGAEALARWTDAAGTEIPPAEFIPIAEANGLIVPLGRRVVELACRALAKLDAVGFPHITIAVNISPLELERREFADELIAILDGHGIAPGRIEIEVTESAAMRDHQADGRILSGLSAAGFPIAIDDFGTGYSSLSYLRMLSASTLKVDRSFVGEIGTVPDERSITDMIIGLGRRMALNVVAEGVETQAQADWLRRHGCQRAQGYLFGRPVPPEVFVDRLSGRA